MCNKLEKCASPCVICRSNEEKNDFIKEKVEFLMEENRESYLRDLEED